MDAHLLLWNQFSYAFIIPQNDLIDMDYLRNLHCIRRRFALSAKATAHVICEYKSSTHRRFALSAESTLHSQTLRVLLIAARFQWNHSHQKSS